MEISVAGTADVADLAVLLGRFAGTDTDSGTDTGDPSASDLEPDLRWWWAAHRDSHQAFLARHSSGTAVGMAWLAQTARVPRPGRTTRLCGDVQSLYVVPEHRSAGVATALLDAVVRHSDTLGLEHLTVHANDRAVSLYERAGFGASGDLLLRSCR